MSKNYSVTAARVPARDTDPDQRNLTLLAWGSLGVAMFDVSGDAPDAIDGMVEIAYESVGVPTGKSGRDRITRSQGTVNHVLLPRSVADMHSCTVNGFVHRSLYDEMHDQSEHFIARFRLANSMIMTLAAELDGDAADMDTVRGLMDDYREDRMEMEKQISKTTFDH